MILKIQNQKDYISYKKILGLSVGLCALIVNVYSFYLHSTIDFNTSTTGASMATMTWILSIFFLGVSIFILFPPKKNKNDVNKNLLSIEKVFLIGVLILGIILRLYKINHLGLYLDEWFWLTNAKGILDGSIRTPFGFIGDQPSNMPAYVVAFFLAFFKNSYFAVRFPGVLYSLLNIILIFFFLREAFNKKIALIAVLLLSLSIWDIHMSQFGWNNVNLNPFLISGTMFFLYRGIKNFSARDILICGIFLGISINLLYIASLSSIATAIYFLYHMTLGKEKKKVVYLFLLLILTVFMVVSPTIVKINKYSQQSIGRHKNFVSENIAYSKNQTGAFYYLGQLRLAVEDFVYKPDKFRTLMLWGITLEPLVIFFFTVGLIYALIHITSPPFLLTISNFAIMFIPIVVLYRFTSVWREFGFLPTIYIMSSLGMYFLYQLISRGTRTFTPHQIRSGIQLVMLILIIATYLTSWYYFYSLYFNYHLKKETKIYETYCKKTAEYISTTIPPNTLIILPNEMCNDLIKVVLWDKYNYEVYNNEDELTSLIQGNTKDISNQNNVLGVSKVNGVIVQIADSTFSRNNPIHLSEKTIIEEDNIPYAYLYKF